MASANCLWIEIQLSRTTPTMDTSFRSNHVAFTVDLWTCGCLTLGLAWNSNAKTHTRVTKATTTTMESGRNDLCLDAFACNGIDGKPATEAYFEMRAHSMHFRCYGLTSSAQLFPKFKRCKP